MRILITLTYYRPHYSGLTIYVERLALGLAELGHQVTVLTSRYNPGLPEHEIIDGVQIWRLNVLMRISKGVIMPLMPLRAWQLARQSDVVNLHVPQLDSAPIGMISRMLKKPVVLTYHCDLKLPQGIIHALANQASHLANQVSALMANVIVTNTLDYAENSTFLRRHLSKIHIIPPPIEIAPADSKTLASFAFKADIRPGQRLIGMAARLAAEKGVEFLVEAMPAILKRYPQARVLFVGQYQDVLGEEAYTQRLAPMIENLGDHWTFLGVLPPDEFAAFLHHVELTVLPSINSTESYGMVQVESMACGTPVVASDLAGVRQPVRSTGMGKIVPVRDADKLAKAILAILEEPQAYSGDAQAIQKSYSPLAIASKYEEIFQGLARQSGKRKHAK
jgi:glycosyltransferase involved in cell wall biosynthesis